MLVIPLFRYSHFLKQQLLAEDTWTVVKNNNILSKTETIKTYVMALYSAGSASQEASEFLPAQVTKITALGCCPSTHLCYLLAFMFGLFSSGGKMFGKICGLQVLFIRSRSKEKFSVLFFFLFPSVL